MKQFKSKSTISVDDRFIIFVIVFFAILFLFVAVFDTISGFSNVAMSIFANMCSIILGFVSFAYSVSVYMHSKSTSSEKLEEEIKALNAQIQKLSEKVDEIPHHPVSFSLIGFYKRR